MIQVNVKLAPLALSAAEACEYVGSIKLFEDMRKAKWIAPCVNVSHKLMLFDRKEIESCYSRLRAGEYPETKGTL